MSSQREGKPDSADVTADPATIYRDAKPGSGSSASATAPVDTALSTKGSGMAHSSGATFHDDSTSHAAADALGANAFTAGNDVYFGAGQLAPNTPTGDKLIQHELTHVEQSRGVQSPEPGNFRVSSHNDAAEVSARGEGAGGAGSASTIYRDDKTGGAAPPPAVGGAGPAVNAPGGNAGGTNAGGTGPGANAGADAYEAFKSAITAHDRAGANDKWSKLGGDLKAKVSSESVEFHRNIVWALHKDAPKVLKEGNIPLGPITYAIFLDDEFDQWLPEMRAQGLLVPFLLLDPKKELVSRNVAQKLKTWVDGAGSFSEAKQIFQKVYPTLLDSATLSQDDTNSGVSVVAWSQTAQVAHLFDTLVNFLPVGHVQTIQGFFLMTTSATGKHKGSVWGWWQPWNFLVALPLHSGTASHSDDVSQNGNSDMTGGSRSGANVTTNPDGSQVANQQMGHYEGTVLHEVGHGVGARMGGDTYAKNPASWPGWTPVGYLGFATSNWEEPTGTGDTSVAENAQHIDSGQATNFMMSELQSGKPDGKIDRGWFHSDPTRDDIVKWLTTRYSNVPLQKWWKHIIVDGNSADDSYTWDDPVRHRGGWTYGVLTRAGAGAGRFMKFKQEAYQKKVSFYGISSPLEWFAEQYAHYYRTEKTGAGLIDSSTKDLLDRLDQQAWAPTNADGSQGVQYPTALNKGSGAGGDGGGAGAGSGVAGAGGQTAAQQTPPPTAQKKEPLFFPW